MFILRKILVVPFLTLSRIILIFQMSMVYQEMIFVLLTQWGICTVLKKI